MGGVAKSVTSLGTRIGMDMMTGGLAEIGGTSKNISNRIGSAVGGAFGDKPYTPATLPNEDPKLLLAQSGGAPLLTQIALGASVDDALAGYFGKSSGADFQQYYASLKPEEQSAIDSVKHQLTQIQSNTDLRNKAVQQVVNDFPNIVSRTAPSVLQAKSAAGQEFDDASKQYLDYAMQKTAAYMGANGNISSGAAIEAQARNAADMGLQRLDYQNQQGNQQLDLLGQGWQQQYNEANALRNFQNTMLGQGVSQGFSANQAYLNRNQQNQLQNAGFANQQHLYDQQSNDQMFGALGGLAGTVAGAYFGGPMGAAIGGKLGSMGGSGFSTNYMSPPSTNFSGNPRLNLERKY